jgi:malate permease and related proteins
MSHFFLPVLYSLLQILILAGIGFVLRRYAKWDKSIFTAISKLLINITLPAMFLTRMSSLDRADLSSGILFPFYALIIIGISLLMGLILSQIFRIPKESRKVYLALCTFSNAGYIPLALFDIFDANIGRFGEFFNIPQPSLYIGSFIIIYSPFLWSIGNYFITGATGKFHLKQFITPPVIGILCGVLLCLAGSESVISDYTLPFHYIHEGLKTLGSVTSPLILIVLGAMIGELELNRSLTIEDIKFAFTPMLIRYGILPISFLLLLKYLPVLQTLAPSMLLVMFIEITIPIAANFSIMTKTAGKNEKSTALALLVSYGSYLFILPFYMMIFFNLIHF